jgi:hypothetical protein
MKTIFRVILAMMTLIAFPAAHAATPPPISTLQNAATGQCLTMTNPLTMTACDGLPHQEFSFGNGAIYNSNGPAYAHSARAYCLDGSLSPESNEEGDGVNGLVGMGLCAQLNGYWFRPGHQSKHLYMSGSFGICLTQVGSTVDVETCNPANPNSEWIFSGAVPDDWPHAGLTNINTDGGCLQIPGGQISGGSKGVPLAVAGCGDQYLNSFFRFAPNGTILSGGDCLSSKSDSVGDPLTIQNCDGTARQQWHLSGVQIVSDHNNLCIGYTGNSSAPGGAPAQLQTCAPNNFQQNWSMPSVSGSWPPPAGYAASTTVPNATLTAGQVAAVVDWIHAEHIIGNTPFCYKQAAYDRGIGIAPDGCPSGQDSSNGICYDSCRAGYNGIGPVCWSTQSLTYNPGQHCVQHLPDWLGGACIWTAMNACRAGYTGDQIATCWLNSASYGRGVGTPSTFCKSNRQMQAGLCYLNPRTGYDCTLTGCTQGCAAPSEECGVSACVKDQASCAANIFDMVVGPLEVLAFVASEGEMGAITLAVNNAKNELEIAKRATEIYQAEEILRNNLQDFMDMAETHLASISSDTTEAAVAAGYVKGSANYRYIAREWAARLLMATLADLFTEIDKLMLSSMDETGVVSTINAFTHPPCFQHTTMPQF